MALREGDVRRAEQAMRTRLASGPRAVGARYDRRRKRIVVSLDNRVEFAFPSDLAQSLGNATPQQLAAIEVSPTGLGLHWPDLDADLYLPALLTGVFGSRRWVADRTDRRGSRPSRTAKKSGATAARVGRGRRVGG